MSSSSFPSYTSSSVTNGQENNFSLDTIFEDFLFNDFPDLIGIDFDMLGGDEGDEGGQTTEMNDKKRKERGVTDDLKIDRRERNKEHAKKSRVRRKFMMESLQQSVKILKTENSKLKTTLSGHFPKNVIEVKPGEMSLLAGDGVDGNCSLDNQDYNLVRALQTAQQNFIVTDPTLPDNPIVFASHGFLALTGYSLSDVLGRNCRFLQGPQTSLEAVARVSKAVKMGMDNTTVLVNYRKDGTTFWNQLFIAALRDGNGTVVNYLGVQCRVSEMYASSFFKKEAEEARLKQEKTWGAVTLPLPSGSGDSV